MSQMVRRPNVYSGATGSAAGIIVVNTGALTAGVTKTVTHGMGVSNYQLQVTDSNNNVDVDLLMANTTNPTTQLDIQVGVDVPGGLDISVIGG